MQREGGSALVQETSRTRLAVINLLVLSLLVTLVARLWFLQVLTGREAQELAERTSVRLIHQDAPRGFVFDRRGETLARNRTALTLAVDASRLPTDDRERDEVVERLARALSMSTTEVREVVEDPTLGFYTPRPLALDVDKDMVIGILENQDDFPGVMAVETPVREYPLGSLAAHVVGHIGQINAEELEARREVVCPEDSPDAARAYRPGVSIGKIGVERVYEDWLRGCPGLQKIAVDVRGRKVQHLGSRQARRGYDAVLSIDVDIQRAAEEALVRGVELARQLPDPDTGDLYKAPAGAVVALDPRSGEVLALASYPTFDPNLFVGPAPASEIRRLNDPDEHFPMLNRAIGEAVPPGSTFKAITAAAAWEAAYVSPTRTFTCPGFYEVGDRKYRDWTPEGHGTVGLSRSLVESCDIVYYELGVEMNGDVDRIGEHLQEIARSFGFGKELGIDLLGERSGLVPDREWKDEEFAQTSRTFDRRWFAGDAANLAIGQGFLQVTPLQLAAAYGAIANGGTVYKPHVLRCVAELDVSRPIDGEAACRDGRIPDEAQPEVIERVPISPGALDFISDAMSGVGLGEGTAAPAFSGFPFERVGVAGKTGTAQMKPRQPFSWFAAYAPVQDPQIVVVAFVEEGGTGSQIAAPIVRRVIERRFGLEPANFEAGARAD